MVDVTSECTDAQLHAKKVQSGILIIFLIPPPSITLHWKTNNKSQWNFIKQSSHAIECVIRTKLHYEISNYQVRGRHWLRNSEWKKHQAVRGEL